MAGVALLDVNVLVALFDPDHVHHDLAHDWFAHDGAKGWATCPVTENGFVRIVSNPKYRPDAPPASAALDRLRRFCAGGHHHFWPDAVSLRDESLFVAAAIRGHRQLTDMYLLGLARKKGGRLATFDRTIALSGVKGAKRDHLAIIEPSSGS
jgi:toxin-antitoxin system PIN domain toxin